MAIFAVIQNILVETQNWFARKFLFLDFAAKKKNSYQ